MCPDAEVVYPAEGKIRYGGRWHGREAISRFFAIHDEEILGLQLNEYVGQGERVLVLGNFRGRTKSTGQEWKTGFVHIFPVRDDEVQRLEACYDTAAAVEAHRVRSAARSLQGLSRG